MELAGELPDFPSVASQAFSPALIFPYAFHVATRDVAEVDEGIVRNNTNSVQGD